MKTNTTEYKSLKKLGQSLIGQTCQSKLLTFCNNKGGKSLRAPMEITGYEIVECNQEPTLMLVVDDYDVFYDTCINFSGAIIHANA